MASMLSTCSGCGVLVKADDDACPHCGVRRRSVSAPLTGGVILLGLMLAGCPADDSTETMGGSATASTTNAGTETGGSTMSGGASMTSTSGMTMSSTTDDPGTTSAQPPYGVPDTTTTGEPDTGTDTDTDGSDTTTDGRKLDLPPDDG